MDLKRRGKRQSSDGPSKKKRRSVVLNFININPKYTKDESFKQSFRERLDGNCRPFPYWQMKNIIHNNKNMVEEIEEELQKFDEWRRKENDLYSLFQTDDFKSVVATEFPALYSFSLWCSLRTSFCEEMRRWLEEVTGIKLTTIDCNGSCYAQSDSLLPHNDLIDTRRFAFVYYLTAADWDSKTDGGNLQLFNSDEEGLPTNVAVELPPARNSLVLFEVSTRSWHRVSEILSDSPRLSINGWFHSERRLVATVPAVEEIPRFSPRKKFALSKVISEDYLTKKSQDAVQANFADNSELFLKKFLLKGVHDGLHEELMHISNLFQVVGPPSKRRIARLDENLVKEGSPNLKSILKTMKSQSFAKLVTDLTGVTLNRATSTLKVSRVEHGSYWVLGDEDASASESDGYSLSVHVFIYLGDWPDNAGGDLIYIAEDEDEELLRVCPSENSAAIVFCEPGVMHFLKVVNEFAPAPYFLFSLTYFDINVVDG